MNSLYEAFEDHIYVIDINVMYGILFDLILGSYFTEEYLNENVYLYILETFAFSSSNPLEPELQNNLLLRQDCWFAHSTVLVRKFLDHRFTER